jgi:quinol monooxygenase YgiN
MAIRVIVTMTAAPGRGEALARFYEARCAEVRREPGCEQYEVFRSAADPERLVLLERWSHQAALDEHARAMARRSPPPPGLRLGAGEREDYDYRRVR